MFKKITAIVLSLACAGTAALSLTSCKGGDADGSGKTKVSILWMEGGGTPYQEDWLALKEIQERANVKLDMQVVPGKDYGQKKSIVLASGEIPDLLTNCWPAEMSSYAKDGVLLPVSDHLDKLPNLKEILEDPEWDLGDTVKDISEADGKFYVLPAMNKTLKNSQCFIIREDIFNKNGIAIPKTYEELHQAMKQLKQIYPESLGTGDLYNGAQIMSFVAEAFDTKGGFSIPWGYVYDYKTKEWYYAPTSDRYKQLLTFMRSMYDDGCLDPEAFTQDSSQWGQKVSNSQYFVFPSNSGPSEAKSQEKKLKELGIEDAKCTALLPLEGPTGIRAVKPSSKNQGGMAMPASVAKKSSFDKIMEFCDWLYYSEEGALLTTIGVEGVTYDIVDGEYQFKPEINTATNPDGTVSLGKDMGINLMGINTLVPDRRPESATKMGADPDQYAFQQAIIDGDMIPKDDPIVKFTTEQSDRAKLLITTLNDYTNQMFMKYMFGKEDLSTWDTFVSECEKKGCNELLEIVKEAWANN